MKKTMNKVIAATMMAITLASSDERQEGIAL